MKSVVIESVQPSRRREWTALLSCVSHRALIAALLGLTSSLPVRAQQLPTGGTVVSGGGTITQPNANTLNVNQPGQTGIYNFQTFSIGAGSTVNFNQPNSSASSLARVVGTESSLIAGALNAKGSVMLVNPNGIAITSTGVVNVGSFTASTLDIKDSDFLAGRYKFIGNGNSAGVSNAGRINVSDGGFAALLGGQVSNSGTITARLGKVGLGAGEMITLDFAGDGFLSVAVPSSQLGRLVDPNGALVTNSGKIRANGGTVMLSAATAANVLRDAVNVPGSIRANSVGTHNGRIVIGGGAGGNVNITGTLAANGGKKNTGGKVDVAGANVNLVGTVSANGKTGGTVTAQADQNLSVTGQIAAKGRDGKGGEISITSADIKLAGAKLDASGATGGGTILIGGGYQGGGSLAHALNTSVDALSTIRADATRSGNGGTIVVWSDGNTSVAGTFTARGGANGGNGGLVETSGKQNLSVQASAYVDTLAPQGLTGNWLLDPKNIIITAGGSTTATTSDPFASNPASDDQLAPSAIQNAASNVTLQANNDIRIDSAITMANAVMLTLNAGRSVTLNANVTSKGGFTATVNDAGADATNRDPGQAAFTMAVGTTLSTVPTTAVAAGAISITTGTLAADSSGATSLAANIGDFTLASFNTSGFAGGAVSAAGAITVTNSQGNINSTATGTISANGASPSSGTNIAGGAGGNVQITAAKGSIGSATTSFGAISAIGGNGRTTNGSGGNGGAVTLNAGTNIWTRSITTTGGTKQGTGTAGAVGAQLLQATNGSITMTTDSLSQSNLTFTANATTGTVTILSATNSATMTIAGAGTTDSQGNPGVGTVNLSASVLSAMTANTLAFGSSANSGYVTIGTLPNYQNTVPTTNLTIPTSLKNIVLTSGAADDGWGSVGINIGVSGIINGAAANIILNAPGAGGGVYLESGTVKTATLTANANNIGSSGSFAYDNTSGTVTLTASGVDSFSGTNSIGLASIIRANTLKLSGPGEIYQQSPGTFVLTNLVVRGGTYIDISGVNTNQISNFAANTTGRIRLYNNINFNIASIDGVDGVTANQFNLTFNSSGKALSQTAAANIIANEFSVAPPVGQTFTATLNLTNTGNKIGKFGANVSTGAIYLYGNNGLIISAIFDDLGNQLANGVSAGTLVLSNSGAVTQTARITATAGTNLLLLGSGDYTLTNTSNSIQTLAANTIGRVNLYDNRNLAIGPVTGFGGVVINGVTADALNLQVGNNFTVTQTQAVNVNSLTLRNSATNGTATYTLTNANNRVGSFAANVGTANAISLTGTNGLLIGGVLYDGFNTLNGVTAGTLTLLNTGSVTQDAAAANRISATNVALLGTGGNYALTNASNAITTLAANTGTINVVNGSSITIGTVGATTGVTGTGAVTVAATGNLTIAAAAKVTAGAGSNAVLSATGNFINSRGSDAISVSGGGRWLVYSAAPGTDTFGGLDSGNTAIWGSTYATLPPGSVSQPNNRYIFAQQPTTLAVTVTGTFNKTYGDDATAALAAFYTITGFMTGLSGVYLGDTAATATSGAASVTSAGADATANASTYAISGSLGTLVSGSGYTFSFTNNGSLNVTPRALTVTADAQSRTYGEANPTSGSAASNNLVNGDSISTVSLSTPATVASNVGSYDLTGSAAVFGSGLASNYAITYATRTNGLTVTQRALTVTADAQNRAYGDANPTSGGASGNNLVNGDTVSSVALSSPATTASNVGAYDLTGSTAVFSTGLASNYAISYATRTNGLTVTQRALTIAADAQNRTYGDANPTNGGASGNNLANGDTISSVALASPATIASNVGAYDLTGSAAVFGSGLASNYAISYSTRTGGLNVTQRALTITADAQSRVYGNANPASGSAAGNNLVNGDTISSVSLSSPATTASNVGTYDLTGLAAVFGNGLASNYAITYATRANGLTVTPRAITVAADAQSRVYGDANPLLGYQITSGNLVNSDSLSGSLGTSANITSNVGSYAIVRNTLGNDNYAISYVGANLAITPATLLFSATPMARTPGTPNPALSGTVTGFKNGESVTTFGGSLWSTLATTASPAGSYAVNGTLANVALNYTFVQAPANATALTVNAAPVTPGNGTGPTPVTPSAVPPVPPSTPGTPTNITFAPTTGGPVQISLTQPARVAAAPTDVVTVGLPDSAQLATNNGMTFPPISLFDQNQYSRLAVPDYAPQAGEAAVFTMIARAADPQQASNSMIDGFWSGTAAAWTPPGSVPQGKVTFADATGKTVAPADAKPAAFVPGTTDLVQLLKGGPVILSGGQPARFLLATTMSADGKGIVANDPETGTQVTLGYDAAGKTLGAVTSVFDASSKAFVPVANAGALKSSAGAALGEQGVKSLQTVKVESFLTVSVK